MTSFATLQKRRMKLVEELVQYSCGMDYQLVEKVVVYGECLQMGADNLISENTFISQMAQHFNLTIMKTARVTHRNLTLEQYCKLVCIFLTDNIDVKINFVFHVYDLDCDDQLSRGEIYSMLKPTLPQSEEEQEDMLKDLIDLVMRAVDRDGNGRVDVEEFRALVKKDVLYIELLGQCLPDEKYARSFRKKLNDSTFVKLKEMFQSEYTLELMGDLIPSKNPGYYPFPLDY